MWTHRSAACFTSPAYGVRGGSWGSWPKHQASAAGDVAYNHCVGVQRWRVVRCGVQVVVLTIIAATLLIRPIMKPDSLQVGQLFVAMPFVMLVGLMMDNFSEMAILIETQPVFFRCPHHTPQCRCLPRSLKSPWHHELIVMSVTAALSSQRVLCTLLLRWWA